MPSIPFSLDRFIFEHDALVEVSKAPFMSKDSLVRVPDVLFYDPKYHVLILEDAGDLPTLNNFMSTSSLASTLASQIGTELAIFLRELHIWGKGNDRLKSMFTKNMAARQMCSWRWLGRLSKTANKYAIAQEGGAVEAEELELEWVKEVNWKAIADKYSADILANEDTFNMGDYWTGNIIVSTSQEGTLECLFIIDWELPKYGPASTDVAQFAAESWPLRHFRVPSAGSTLLESFFTAYKEGYTVDVRQVAVHLGSHVAVLLGYVDWGDEESTKKTIRSGLEMIAKGQSQNLDWFRQSDVFKTLVSN